MFQVPNYSNPPTSINYPGSGYVPSVYGPTPWQTTAPRAQRLAYTGGTFDLFHPGHVAFLKKCKALCDQLVVGVNRDEFVKKYKGRSPILTLKERMAMLEACKYVDSVIVNSSDGDSKPTVTRSNAKIVIHGDDWTGQEYLNQMGFTDEWLEKEGIALVYVPYTKGVSTTDLIHAIKTQIQT